MCYGSNCLFEDSRGECVIQVGYEEFKKKYGYKACVVGGSEFDGEDFIKWYNEHLEEMNKIYEQYLKDQENKYKRFEKRRLKND